MAAALGVSPDDIDIQAPVQQFGAGSTFAIIVPLPSLDALQRSRLDLQALAPLAHDGYPPLVLLV
jgi:predicted PhzF superfamily epimerase YddE/YHI9